MYIKRKKATVNITCISYIPDAYPQCVHSVAKQGWKTGLKHSQTVDFAAAAIFIQTSPTFFGGCFSKGEVIIPLWFIQ